MGGRGQAGEENERGASRGWLALRLLSRLELCCVVASVVRMGNEEAWSPHHSPGVPSSS